MKAMTRTVSGGFSLIELMIVVAIIGTLTAVALPMYSGYTQRATATAGLTALESYKTAIAMCLQGQGTLTNCNAGSFGIPPAITANGIVHGLEQTQVSDGIINARLSARDLDSNYIDVSLTPDISSAVALQWRIACSDFAAVNGSRVASCKIGRASCRE